MTRPCLLVILGSETRFLAEGVAVEFVPGPGGAPAELVVSIVEGDLKGVRVP